MILRARAREAGNQGKARPRPAACNKGPRSCNEGPRPIPCPPLPHPSQVPTKGQGMRAPPPSPTLAPRRDTWTVRIRLLRSRSGPALRLKPPKPRKPSPTPTPLETEIPAGQAGRSSAETLRGPAVERIDHRESRPKAPGVGCWRKISPSGWHLAGWLGAAPTASRAGRRDCLRPCARTRPGPWGWPGRKPTPYLSLPARLVWHNKKPRPAIDRGSLQLFALGKSTSVLRQGSWKPRRLKQPLGYGKPWQGGCSRQQQQHDATAPTELLYLPLVPGTMASCHCPGYCS